MASAVKITIITPTYNRPDLLIRAIKSARSQTFQDWEMIIVDDSTIQEAIQKNTEIVQVDTRIKYIKNPHNMGAAHCRNLALDDAAGEWVTLLDDDDVFYESASLDTMHSESISDTDSTWHTFMCVKPDGEAITRQLVDKDSYNWIKDFLYGKSFRGDATHLIKRDLIADIRNYGSQRSEWQFWYNLAEKSNFIYHPIPIVVREYLEGGLTDIWQGKRDRVFLLQQLFHAARTIRTWKYIPLIGMRYLASFNVVSKVYISLKT